MAMNFGTNLLPNTDQGFDLGSSSKRWNIYGTLTGNAATATKLATARTISLTGSVTGSGSFDGSGNLSIATTTNHTHSYLPLSGGTETGNITFSDSSIGVRRVGRSVSWNKGRDSAVVKTTSISGYGALASIKTTNGSWDIGVYNNSSYYDDLLFSYVTDTLYNGSSANYTAQIKFLENGHIVAALDGTATNATNIYSSASTSKAYILGTTTASSANHATVYNASVYTSGSVLYGAAWNDYAEYRESEVLEPGRCVTEVGDDTLIMTTRRLQPGCEIVSDTFGFAIGETEECKTPIASSGRVLAYPWENREEFRKHIGEPVCSGPDGTVSIMTPEEEMMYPSRIIGTISAVPDYEEWGSGNVKVNGRVWIRIK